MNSASKHAVIALLAISIAGCADKKAKTAPPAQAQAPAQTPAISAGKAGALYPPPLTESQTQPEESTPPPAPVEAQSQPPEPPPSPPPSTKKSTSHKQKPSPGKPAAGQPGSTQAAGSEPATQPAGQAAAATTPATTETPTDVAASGEPAASSPIGELTPGDTPGQAEKGKETADLIANTENGLNSIKKSLTPQEQETFNQIKTFLNKAKIALTNQDLDGAFILATKAKVLLDELNKAY
jgi:hypothetical protein